MMKTNLFTISYPDISEKDRVFIEEFRQIHDAQLSEVVKAHFTFVFGVDQITESDYMAHIQKTAEASSEIAFTCRYAMLGADHFSDKAIIFLVPDEGYSAISLLHDQLYTGVLKSFHRLDIPFIPHITIGTMSDREKAKSLCDELNGQGLELSGSISSLSVGALGSGKFNDLAHFNLSKQK